MGFHVSLALGASGCGLVTTGLQKASNAQQVAQQAQSGVVSTSGQAPLQAFQNSFYAFGRMNCAQCHGSSQTPMFAAADIHAAYANAKPYADFSNPSNSLLVQFAGNGHCGVSNCSGSSQSNAALSALNAWAASENNPASSQNPGFSSTPGSSESPDSSGTSANSALIAPSTSILWVTAPMPIPSNLPAVGSGKTAIIRWTLSNLTPANSALNGAVFEVQANLLDAQFYEIEFPKLATANGMNVKGIHVMIKKSTDPGLGNEFAQEGQTWNSVNTNVSATPIPKPLPTTSLQNPALSTDKIQMPVLSSNDVLIIGFEGFTPIGSATCKNLNGTNSFVSNVKPQMQNICFRCHLQGGSGYALFPMVSNNDSQLCATTLSFINVNNPGQSLLVLNPEGNNGHPTTSIDPTPFIQWIQTEK